MVKRKKTDVRCLQTFLILRRVSFHAMLQEGNINLYFKPACCSSQKTQHVGNAAGVADARIVPNKDGNVDTGAVTLSQEAGRIIAGDYSATWSEKQNRWNIFNAGTQVTSATKEAKARTIVCQLRDGTHKSQCTATPAVAGTVRRAACSAPPAVVHPQSRSHCPNPWGCKGKPGEDSTKQELSSPKKRARAARTAAAAIGPSSSYKEVISHPLTFCYTRILASNSYMHRCR